MRLKVEKLVYGGLGLCRTDEGVVFVDQVLPGEVVEAEVAGKRGGARVARIQEILEKSPDRIMPRCEYYTVCGGCDWQYIDYAYQTRVKRDIFIDCLQRIGKIDVIPEIEVFTSPEWHCRIRAQFQVDADRGYLGFFKKGTHEIVPVKTCPLLDSAVDNILQNQSQYYHVLPRNIMQIKVIAGSDGAVASKPVIEGLTQDTVKISVGDAVFSVNGDSFFQGNGFLLQELGGWATQQVSGKFFIDMYGGLGFFSVMLGRNYSKGLIVESVREQAVQAKANLVTNAMEHIAVKAVSAEEFFRDSKNLKARPDLLVLDPPRTGLSNIVRQGICDDLKPAMILYVSCDPSTQARDVGLFTKKYGYSIGCAALFDLYPQTHHIETVLLLRYNN